MSDFYWVEKDIEDIMSSKSKGREEVLIYRENINFFEELLEKKFSIIIDDEILARIDLNEISLKDITTLQEYLEYINMIGD